MALLKYVYSLLTSFAIIALSTERLDTADSNSMLKKFHPDVAFFTPLSASRVAHNQLLCVTFLAIPDGADGVVHIGWTVLIAKNTA